MDLFIHVINKANDVLEYYKDYTKNNSTRFDSGLDVLCPNDMIVPPKAISYKIPLGIKCQPQYNDNIPRGYFVLPRSSMGSKTPLRQSNSIGLIDYGYRGELMLVVDNLSDKEYKIEKNARLCQIVSYDASPITVHTVNSPDEFKESKRGEGGFGSTGTNWTKTVGKLDTESLDSFVSSG